MTYSSLIEKTLQTTSTHLNPQHTQALAKRKPTCAQGHGISVVPNARMPLLFVVVLRANLAALELVAFVEAIDSLRDDISEYTW
jgi:hypothetical protein